MVHQSLFEEVRELQTRIEEQNRRLARLEHQLQTLKLCGPSCPRCDQGEMPRMTTDFSIPPVEMRIHSELVSLHFRDRIPMLTASQGKSCILKSSSRSD